ncbi:hypothetical protein EL18_01394 [Nitratireductor basaltis]|uniref:Uncharacterized protein n=1 Tax=Nitratireductor basaltis TaxID=472175 RepID=A0A084UBM7_9HYPH|nr:hypothetical protein EL18_01394 [Nitratireductor basaltis]
MTSCTDMIGWIDIAGMTAICVFGHLYLKARWG